jgi:hypothetical protein
LHPQLRICQCTNTCTSNSTNQMRADSELLLSSSCNPRAAVMLSPDCIERHHESPTPRTAAPSPVTGPTTRSGYSSTGQYASRRDPPLHDAISRCVCVFSKLISGCRHRRYCILMSRSILIFAKHSRALEIDTRAFQSQQEEPGIHLVHEEISLQMCVSASSYVCIFDD